jgi:H+/Cl- antiporter ClcA/CBS domain-containing protein
VAHDEIAETSSTDGLPVAPSLGPTLEREHYRAHATLLDRRSVFLCGVSIILALGAAVVAQVLTALIALITNLSFHQRVSFAPLGPAGNTLGIFVVVPPIVGALIIGLMARYGSSAIRGHGIPEAMERVLQHESKIPPHMTWLKPISAAISIGTGGPFGAEGPIIATGGSLGSLWGQLMRTTSHERKTLLAAGAAAGMAATFGSPVSAVLLAIELLLFEWSPRSLVPVGLACVTASTARVAMVGSAPVFPMPVVDAAAPAALVAYLVIGAIVGAAAVLVTRAVYAVEDAFEKLPVHWMWWPAIGAVVVGVVGYFAPHTMGVGYDNIEAIVSGHLVGRALLVLCTLKFISWVIALGSGTSGGTLAPLFTVGGGLGAGIGALLVATIPAAHVDPRIAALVGMAAMFAGASRAVLASVVFAFETTRQPAALLPLLGGCAAAFLVASAWMRQSIMTVKIARRGVYVPDEYGPDPLMGTLAADCATRVVVSLRSKMTIAEARAAIAAVKSRHAAFPVCDEENRVVGLMSHRALLAAEDPEALLSTLADNAPLTIRSDRTLREVVQDMVEAGAGRAVLVDEHGHLAGILTQRDVISAWRKRALH